LIIFGILDELKCEARVFRVKIIDKTIKSIGQKKHQRHTQDGSRLTPIAVFLAAALCYPKPPVLWQEFGVDLLG